MIGRAIISARTRSCSIVLPTSWNTGPAPPTSTWPPSIGPRQLVGQLAAPVDDVVLVALDAGDDERLGRRPSSAAAGASRGSSRTRRRPRRARRPARSVSSLARRATAASSTVPVVGGHQQDEVGRAGAEVLLEEVLRPATTPTSGRRSRRTRGGRRRRRRGRRRTRRRWRRGRGSAGAPDGEVGEAGQPKSRKIEKTRCDLRR